MTTKTSKICSLHDCDRTAVSRGMCKKHYNRAYERGEITPLSQCSIDGCNRLGVFRTWCALHYRRWMTHGDVNTVHPIPGRERSENPSYEAVHLRLNRLDFGPAKDFMCADGCGNPAAEWSYQGECPDELVGGTSKRPEAKYKYCVHGSHYRPRCRSCHIAYDVGRNIRLCSVPGCVRVHNAKGFCMAHYTRLRLHGDVMADRPLKVNPVAVAA